MKKLLFSLLMISKLNAYQNIENLSNRATYTCQAGFNYIETPKNTCFEEDEIILSILEYNQYFLVESLITTNDISYELDSRYQCIMKEKN
ncbi:MAG: hypothetical protein ACRCV0_04495 [Brevinema sp.]